MGSKALKRVLKKIPRAHLALLKSALSGALIFLIAGCGAVGANPNGPNNPPPQPGNPPSIMTSALPDGTEGDGYSTALSGTGGVTPYSWSIVAGQLPAGLTLDANGTISGTPAAIGDFAVTIQVRDSSPTQQSANKALPLRIRPRALRVATNSLPSGTVGMSYSAALAATGGTRPYTWSLASGALPPGLTLTSAGGIAGTPSQSGSFSFTVRVTDSSSPAQTDIRALSLSVAPAPPPPLSITTSSLASGQVGVIYNATLAATGGTTPYSWSLSSGALPAGLTLSSAGGISGIPSQNGSFSFIARVTDSSSPPQSATKALSLTVSPAPPPPLTIMTNTLPSGTVGTAYSVNLAAAGGTTPYAWNLASGTLPAGLVLSTAGPISGTPTQSGSFTFTARVTDSSSPQQSATRSLSISVAPAPPPPLSISTGALPAGTVGTVYNTTLAATGGSSPYSWNLASGALPSGLSLSSAGVISGTPSQSGSFTFTARVTDSSSPQQSATKALSISVAPAPPPPLSISTNSLLSATVGVAYSATLTATGGTTPYSWSLDSGGLPPGLVLSSAGTISGTPSQSGSFSFTARVTDSFSPAQSATKTLSLSVMPPPMSIATSSLPSGTVGAAYDATVAATGGTPAYTWSIDSGALPPGLTLAATSGQITGTPSSAGSFAVLFRVTDSGVPAQSSTRNLTIAIAAGGPLAGPVAAYSFCEGVGAVATDASTNNNAGTIQGAAWTPAGRFGNALLFNGTGNYVEAADINALSPGTEATFEAWISLNAAPTDTASVINKWSQTSDDEYLFGVNTAQKPYLAWQTTGGPVWGTPSFNEASGTGTIPLNTQTHIAVVRRGTQLEFYINGNLDAATNVMDGNPFRNGVTSLRIGGQGRGLINRFFGGMLDEVRIYDRALTQAEIQNDMNTPISVSCLTPLSIVTSNLSNGMINAAFSTALLAGGGTPPYGWSITAGSLPPGLNLSVAGIISGTPTVAGTSTFTVQVTDATGQTSSRVLTLSIQAAATGPQFYVSTIGNDANSGISPAQAWRTIQKAMNSATAGSTVNIMAGIYRERLVLNVSGTTGNYITFQPNGFSVPAGGCGGYTGVTCGGDVVSLDYSQLGTVTDSVPFLLISGKSHVRIQGLTFQNYTTFGAFQQGVRIDGGSSFIEFRHNRFMNNKDTGPWTGCCAFLHIRAWSSNQIIFYGNEIGNIVSNYSEALTADVGATNFVAENNWVHDTDGIGIDMRGGSDYIVRGNRLQYISKKRDGTFWYGSPAAAIYNDGGNTGVIERNFVSHAGVGLQALSEPGLPATHDVTMRNNVVEYCQTGMVLGTWYSNTDGSSVFNISAFNNTFYGNNVGVVVRPMVSATVTWRNNIFANNGATYVNTLNWNPGNAGFNVYFGGGVGPGSNALTSDPLLTDPLAEDYSLQLTSPAVNTGDPSSPASVVGTVDLTGNPRIVGGRIDRGATERQ